MEMWWIINGDVVAHWWRCVGSLMEMWWLIGERQGIIVGNVAAHYKCSRRLGQWSRV